MVKKSIKFPKAPKMPKLPKLPKVPKLVLMNKPSTPTKHIMLVMIVVLVVFTVVYAFKMFSTQLERFEEEKKELIVKLVFSDTCGHCRQFKPKFESVASKVSSEDNGNATIRFAMTPADKVGGFSKFVSDGIPAVLFIKGEDKPENVDPSLTLVGNMEEAVFEQRVRDFMRQ